MTSDVSYASMKTNLRTNDLDDSDISFQHGRPRISWTRSSHSPHVLLALSRISSRYIPFPYSTFLISLMTPKSFYMCNFNQPGLTRRIGHLLQVESGNEKFANALLNWGFLCIALSHHPNDPDKSEYICMFQSRTNSEDQRLTFFSKLAMGRRTFSSTLKR